MIKIEIKYHGDPNRISEILRIFNHVLTFKAHCNLFSKALATNSSKPRTVMGSPKFIEALEKAL